MSILSSLARENKRLPPGGGAGPPFAPGSAVNGASLDLLGRIVLGQQVGAVGDPAQFLDNREIPMNGFSFTMVGNVGADPLLILNDSGIGPYQAAIGDINGALGNNGSLAFTLAQSALLASSGTNYMALFLQSVPHIAQLGDLGGFGNQHSLVIDDTNNLITLQKLFALGLRIDNSAISNLTLGDTTLSLNGGRLDLDDANGIFQYSNNAGLYVNARPQTDKYQFGDIVTKLNGNFLNIEDSIQEWAIGQRTAVTNLLLNKPAAGIGLSYFDENGANPFLIPSATIGGISFLSAPDFSSQVALSDAGSGSVAQLGDVGGLGGNLTLTVNDPGNEVQIRNTALNSKVRINNALGFSGTVLNPITITVNGGIVTNVA